jgi:hypothetical protein
MLSGASRYIHIMSTHYYPLIPTIISFSVLLSVLVELDPLASHVNIRNLVDRITSARSTDEIREAQATKKTWQRRSRSFLAETALDVLANGIHAVVRGPWHECT